MLEYEKETDETPDYESLEFPDLPSGWEWWSGDRADTYYSHWFGTEYRMGGKYAGEYGLGGFEGEVWWDKGNAFTVALFPITGVRDDGDREVSEYPAERETFSSLQDAIDAIPDLIERL